MLLDTPVCDFGWKAPHFTLNIPLNAARLAKRPSITRPNTD